MAETTQSKHAPGATQLSALALGAIIFVACQAAISWIVVLAGGALASMTGLINWPVMTSATATAMTAWVITYVAAYGGARLSRPLAQRVLPTVPLQQLAFWCVATLILVTLERLVYSTASAIDVFTDLMALLVAYVAIMRAFK